MAQAAASDSEFLDRLSRLEDGPAAAEVDIGGGQVAQALVVAVVVVVIDEVGDGGLELAGQEVILQQDATFQGLVPALDLALGLGVVWRAADVGDALALEPPRKIAGDVGCAVIAEQPGPVDDLRGIAARGRLKCGRASRRCSTRSAATARPRSWRRRPQRPAIARAGCAESARRPSGRMSPTSTARGCGCRRRSTPSRSAR